MVPMVTLTI